MGIWLTVATQKTKEYQNSFEKKEKRKKERKRKEGGKNKRTKNIIYFENNPFSLHTLNLLPHSSFSFGYEFISVIFPLFLDNAHIIL